MENTELTNQNLEQHQEEAEGEEHYFMRLGRCEIPLHDILFELNIIDQVKFASTNKKIRDCVIANSKIMREIQERGCFDLDLFPNLIITKNEIDIVHRTFENLKKLKIDMSFAKDTFFDEIRKFRKLEKISIFIGLGDHNYNRHRIYLKSVTIRAKFFTSDTDVIYSLLRQISGTKIISIYNGSVSLGLITLFETRKLRKLKIHNSTIKSCYYFEKYILQSTSLEHLKVTSEQYMMTPHPVIIMSDIINQLDKVELNLKYLSFTVDTCCLVKYDNLSYLTKLNKLEIYYSVQTQTLNLEKLIYITAKLEKVQTTFIEYFDKNQIFNRAMFDATERKSYYYKNIMESMDKHIEVRAINYDELRLEDGLSYLEI